MVDSRILDPLRYFKNSFSALQVDGSIEKIRWHAQPRVLPGNPHGFVQEESDDRGRVDRAGDGRMAGWRWSLRGLEKIGP